MTLQQRERIGSIIRSVVVIAIALICAVPLYVIVINTFKSSAEMSMDPIGLPKTWNFENYTYAFGHLPIVNAFKNTIIVTVVGVGLQVLFGALAAYGMILKKSKFTAVIGVLLMLSFIIPGQTLLIPQYRMEAQVGLVDSLLGLIVLYTGGATFCYFLIVQYMRGLPYEIIEAARIDGAGPFRIFWTIVLPLIRPILTTVIVFQTMGTWNDFMTPSVYISSTNKQTIVLQVFNAISTFTTNWPLFMTVTTIALIPGVRVLHLLPALDRGRPGRRFGQGLTGPPACGIRQGAALCAMRLIFRKPASSRGRPHTGSPSYAPQPHAGRMAGPWAPRTAS